jgi:hypothetical protein
MKHRAVVLACAVLATFAGPATVARAATLTPNTVLDGNTPGDGQCSLREAVNATRSVGTPGDCGTASGNDTIMLAAATYMLTIGGAGENVNQTGDLDIAGAVTATLAISGAGPGATTIDAGGLGDRILEFVGPSSLALSGVTLTGGHPATGTPFPGNNGGAIRAIASGTLAIVNSVITGNHAADGAAGTSPAGTGGPGGAGGGIYATTRLTVTDSVISANHSGNGGAGGAGADDDKANGGNGGTGGDAGGGGGIYAPGGPTSLTITNTTISGNSAGSGGTGGAGGTSGLGALATGGTGGTGGFGGPGGGLFVGGETLSIANSTLSGNSAGAGGTGGRGGEGNTGGTGGLGQIGGYAGGIASLDNQINLTNVTLADNSAGTGGDGGNGGPSQTTGNGGNGGNGARGGHGGALLTANLGGSDALVHGTLSGNSAGAAGPGGSGGKGGGGATGTDGPPGAGGDIFGGQPGMGSPLNIANTITVGASAPACLGFIANGGHNVFADGCFGPPASNPLLGPLQNNGGPTQTMALQPGSPAIDLVPTLAAQCPGTDQRGVFRPAGGACDAGAYEVAPPSATTGPATGVDSSNATLTGSVRPNSSDASVQFEYGPTTGYGSQTVVQHLSGSADQPVNAALTGLSPSTTYHFRVVAAAADGTATGADQTFTTAAAPPGSTGTGGNGATPPLAAATRFTLAPSSFRAASSGPAAKPAKLSIGTTVRYTLNIGASVRFTVVRLLPGRRVKGRCVKPTRLNRSARKCTRRVRVRGSFTRTGSAGPNRFRFMGRIGGRKLTPGDYRLVATPTANGVRGRATSTPFHIVP